MGTDIVFIHQQSLGKRRDNVSGFSLGGRRRLHLGVQVGKENENEFRGSFLMQEKKRSWNPQWVPGLHTFLGP